MNVVYGLGACLLGLGVLAGWGEISVRLFKLPRLCWPLNLPVGLAVILIIGGGLNAAGAAYPLAFDALAVIGAATAAWMLFRQRSALRDVDGRRQAAAVLFALVMSAIPASFLTPVTVFDFIDDFEKYFAYPMRMLETGTLAGGTLNSTPLETIGGGAFLQGFVLAHAPLSWVNLADVVFGQCLCSILLAGTAMRRGWPTFAFAIPAVALVFVINPQYVNVSPLYIPTFLIAAIILLTADAGGKPPTPVVGLLVAALIILKTSLVPFAAGAVLAFGFAVLFQDGARKALRQVTSVLVWAAGGILPWLVVHRARFEALLSGNTAFAEAEIPVLPPGDMDLLDLLSFTHLPYGASYGAYTLVAIGGLLISLVVCAECRVKDGAVSGTTRSVALLSAATLGVFITVMAYSQARDFAHFAVRLLIPTILGSVTAVAVAAVMTRRPYARAAGLGGAILLLAVFGRECPDRFNQMANGNSLLAFTWLADKPDYREFTTTVVGPDWRDRLRSIQAKVPEKEAILVWTTTPFVLDYARNPLYEIDLMGLGAPWSQIPKAHYVLWEYRGFAVRGMEFYESASRSRNPNVSRSGRRAIALARRLQALAARSPVVHFDRNFVLFRTEEAL